MKKVLLISLNTNLNTPKAVRHKNIIKYLDNYCKLTIVQYDKFISHTSTVSHSKTLASRFKKLIYRQFIRRFSIPDEFIFIRRWYVQKSLSELKSGSYDTVILGVLPFSFYRIAGSIKKIFPHVKLIIDISDPFYGNVNVLHSRNLLLKLFAKSFEKKYVTLADHLVVLNEEIKTFYKNTYGIKNVSVIEQGVDNLLIEKIKKSFGNIAGQEKVKNEPVVLIYGGIFYKRLREPFELFKAVKSSNQDIKLKLFGKINPEFLPGPSSKIEYHGRVSQEELFNEYYKADIIVFIDNAYGIQVPGKTIELMMFNKPILFISSNDNSPSIKYFQNYDKLIRIPNNSENIIQWLNDMKIPVNTEANIDKDLSVYYWENLIPKFLPIIDQAVN